MSMPIGRRPTDAELEALAEDRADDVNDDEADARADDEEAWRQRF